ncbi:MAG: 50S ribosomal protein L18 [Deltaproteobacteria bacterium]|nr:50S ribosomal protein L18 [Deltaproteobacteria bacterium]
MSDYQRKRTQQKNLRRKRSHLRLRKRLRGTAERPRLAVRKSLRYVYAQLIDDDAGKTLAQANSREGVVQEGLETSAGSRQAARKVGQVLAERAKEQGVEQVVFDRGGFIFHGKIREIAEGAREKGLGF